MDDPSCVGAARRHVAALCRDLDFDEVASGQAAIIVNELGSNLCKHVRNGQLWIAARQGDTPEIEMLSVDSGPGISDVALAMRDGFSTAGSPGTGLGAVQRLATDFDLHSDVDKGTVILARLRPGAHRKQGFKWGVVALPAPGETVCGDSWGVAFEGKRAAMLVADGLGHGEHAAHASLAAVELFAQQPFAELKSALEQAHVMLRMTRGAAVTRAQLDAEENVLRAVGAGNVAIRVVSGVFNRSVLAQHGTVGVQMRRVEETGMNWPAHALVVCHSDGLQSRWPPEAITALIGRDPALAAAVLVRDYGRGRDDVTVLVMRRDD
ncbi:ATP-binding SpoIIE family protein phosphatase [Acidovorax sp. CCYZU-2555]|uniref:ATP-binding SpoIIE family protein phosphatase n=1 Tax=Acidovorax sp. CCYZU-2555 TaxID=2835042 RepID=UPI001BCC6DFB|nr:ATP-binding SpoIIE family protein phosphatase [Acidovorax sp. CCYZU-2555]MBS7778699.1 SpoIIE family protein phosphatase [Acidovorax sp. CCYZU-2555]